MKTKSIHFRISEEDLNIIKRGAVYFKIKPASFITRWIKIMSLLEVEGFFDLLTFLKEKTGKNESEILSSLVEKEAVVRGYDMN